MRIPFFVLLIVRSLHGGVEEHTTHGHYRKASEPDATSARLPPRTLVSLHLVRGGVR
jgi:hypothetical protein